MVKNHLKRIATPKTWNVLRKTNTFVTRPNPGAHKFLMGISVNTLLKEIIGVAKTTKEVKKILHDKQLKVDGSIRHDEKFNIGFMDVLSLDKKHYRVLLNSKGKLVATEIKGAETKQKLSKISGKKQTKGGKNYLCTKDGRTIAIEKDTYKVGDSILLSLPEQKIEAHFPFKEGSHALIIRGKHAGTEGTIQEISEGKVLLKTKEGEYLTKKDYAYIVGDKKAIITCLP